MTNEDPRQVLKQRMYLKQAVGQFMHLRMHIQQGGTPRSGMTTQICHIMLHALFDLSHLRRIYADCDLTPDDLFLIVVTPWELEEKGELANSFVIAPEPMPIGCVLVMDEERIRRLGNMVKRDNVPRPLAHDLDFAQPLRDLRSELPQRAEALVDATKLLASEILREIEEKRGAAIVERMSNGGVKTPMPIVKSGCLGVLFIAGWLSSTLALGFAISWCLAAIGVLE